MDWSAKDDVMIYVALLTVVLEKKVLGFRDSVVYQGDCPSLWTRFDCVPDA